MAKDAHLTFQTEIRQGDSCIRCYIKASRTMKIYPRVHYRPARIAQLKQYSSIKVEHCWMTTWIDHCCCDFVSSAVPVDNRPVDARKIHGAIAVPPYQSRKRALIPQPIKWTRVGQKGRSWLHFHDDPISFSIIMPGT